jgi:hypothetical protein
MNHPSTLVVLLERDSETAKSEGTQDMREALLAGLFWQTNYWVDCALLWIEHGAEIDDEIFVRLNEISSNKSYPQKTRHTAFKYAARWEKKINEKFDS